MNDLSHKRARRLIQQERLKLQERADLGNHLQNCDGCHRYASIHLYLTENLHLEPARTTATPEFRMKIQSRARYLDRRNRIMKPVQALAGVAIVAIILFFGWLVLRPILTQEQGLSAVEPTELPSPASTSAMIAKPVAPKEGSVFNTEIAKGILYATVGDGNTRLDVHAPREPGPWPVVVLVHGYNATRYTTTSLAEVTASRGAVVYNINAAFTPKILHGIKRVACGVRYARATAADYGGDASRITLVGNNAGAALGLVVALAEEDFEGDCIMNEESAHIDVLVAYDGSFDHATSDPSTTYDLAYSEEEDPDLWLAINPYTHIGRNPELQVRLIAGDDTNPFPYDIPRQVSIDLHQALLYSGYDVTLTLLDVGHLQDYEDERTEAFNQIVDQAISSAYGP
jgi:dienelactone hydrolase